MGDCQQKGISSIGVLEEAEFQLDELGLFEGPGAGKSSGLDTNGGSWDALILLHSGGQHSAHVVKGNCGGDAPRQ